MDDDIINNSGYYITIIFDIIKKIYNILKKLLNTRFNCNILFNIFLQLLSYKLYKIQNITLQKS